jgi:hypothetical protein
MPRAVVVPPANTCIGVNVPPRHVQWLYRQLASVSEWVFLDTTCRGCTASSRVSEWLFLHTACRGCTASSHVYRSDCFSTPRVVAIPPAQTLYTRMASRTALWRQFVCVFISTFSVVSYNLIQKVLCNSAHSAVAIHRNSTVSSG